MPTQLLALPGIDLLVHLEYKTADDPGCNLARILYCEELSKKSVCR